MKYIMKKWYVGLMLAIGLLHGITVQAEEETESTVNYTYVEVTGGVEITGYTGEEMEIVIPAALAGKKVVSIGEKAFKSNNGVTKITVPDTVEMIGACAFGACTSLRTIKLSSGLKEIGDEAFFGCSALSAVEIPHTVERIGIRAFRSTAIATIVLPSSVTELGMSAFMSCTKLEKVVINASITETGTSVFQGCSKLKNVVILGEVQSLGVNSFSLCTSLSEVEISSKVTSINDHAFYGYPKDMVVYTTYGSYASQWATEKGLDIGYTVEESKCKVKLLLGETEDKRVAYVDGRDEAAVSITIPDSITLNEEEYAVTEIVDGAFRHCTALEEVVFPSTLQSVSAGAFDGLASDEGTTRVKVTIPETLSDVSNLGIENLTNLDALTICVKAGSTAETYYQQFEDVHIATYGSTNNSTEEESEGTSETTPLEDEKELEETPKENAGLKQDDAELEETSKTEENAEPKQDDAELEETSKTEESAEPKQDNMELDGSPTSTDKKESTESEEKAKIGMIYKVGALRYKVKDVDKVTLVGVTDKSIKKLVVPKTVTIMGVTFRVTAIGKRAIKKCKKLTTVIIGSSVETIGDEAFMNCNRLKKITIGKNVKRLGEKVFYGDKKLTRIIFKGAKVKKIGSKALRRVPKKVKITAPKKAIKTYKKLLNAAK